MAPIKFEEQLKDKLEKRTLSPSAEGWSKLSDRLDADKNQSKSPIFWWLSIAAGLIVMLAVSSQFFNTNDSQEILPQVVNEELNEVEPNKEKQNLMTKEPAELAIEKASLENENEKDNELTKAPQIIDHKRVTNKKLGSKMQLSDNSSLTNKKNALNKDTIINEDVVLTSDEFMMKDAVTSALTELKSVETTVTDREIDSLLKVASKELFKDKLQKETFKTVDVDALLLSVEEDMGESFRSKVFKALKDSYKTVKTKVAERNN